MGVKKLVFRLYALLLSLCVITGEILGPYYFQSENYQTFHLGYGFQDAIVRVSDRGKRFWLHSPGLTGQSGTASLESADKPGFYLRHYSYQLELEARSGGRNPAEFDEDATFLVHSDKYFPGYIAFEAVNYPGFFLRHRSNVIRLDQEDSAVQFRRDASFRREKGPYVLQSLALPWLKLGTDNLLQAVMTETGTAVYCVTPGLTGQPGTVSFELQSTPGVYLRDHGTFLNFESNQSPINPDTFKDDATFLLHPNHFMLGYYAVESTKHPGRFIRQQDHRLRLLPHDGSQHFKEEASFRTVQGPYLLESYNLKGYYLGVDRAGKIIASPNGTSFHLVEPGLNGQPGTVSLEAVFHPAHYLRHFGYNLDLEHKDFARNELQLADDASFYIREEVWRKGDVISLESYNYKQHFIRRTNHRVRLDTFEEADIYLEDVTFYKRAGSVYHPPLTAQYNNTDPNSQQSHAGAILSSIFGGVFLGVGITFLALFLLDKFYFKRVSSGASASSPGSKDSFDNPMYSTKSKSVKMKATPEMEADIKSQTTVIGLEGPCANEYAVIAKSSNCSDSEKYDSDVGFDDSRKYDSDV